MTLFRRPRCSGPRKQRVRSNNASGRGYTLSIEVLASRSDVFYPPKPALQVSWTAVYRDFVPERMKFESDNEKNKQRTKTGQKTKDNIRGGLK
jgi:hypothetical protein